MAFLHLKRGNDWVSEGGGMHHLLVGAGPAGVTAGETLRRLDPDAQITLLCGEPGDPYARMAIPYMLVGHIGEQGTRLRKAETHWEALGIDVRHGRVHHVAADSDEVVLEDGARIAFDRLLLATGAHPVRPPVTGMDLPGVVSCWTLEDARAIVAGTAPGSQVVLMGAGFIGCIILEALVERGVDLTVVEQGPRMVPRMLDETAGRMLQAHCEARGVRVLVATRVESVSGSQGRLSVHTAAGEALSADLVITATGVRSNIGFLEGSGIDCEQGVLVDEFLHSSRAHVFAAGDVAQGPDLLGQGRQVHAIQPTAVEHGRIAAHNMVRAGSVRYQGSLNMNVLDTLGLISVSFGEWGEGGDCSALQLENPEAGRYLKLVFDAQDRLRGAIAVGHTEKVGVLRGLIQSRRSLKVWRDRLEQNPTQLSEVYLGVVEGLA